MNKEITESMHLNLGTKNQIRVSILIVRFEDQGSTIFYNPSLELSSYGDNY